MLGVVLDRPALSACASPPGAGTQSGEARHISEGEAVVPVARKETLRNRAGENYESPALTVELQAHVTYFK